MPRRASQPEHEIPTESDSCVPAVHQQKLLELMAGNAVRLADLPLVVRCALLLEAGDRLRALIDLTSLDTAAADLGPRWKAIKAAEKEGENG